MGTKVWEAKNEKGTRIAEVIMEDPETAEDTLIEIIIEIPMSVYVDPATGEVKWADVWVDRRTPEEYDKGTKFSNHDTITEAYDYFKAHIETPDREET